MSPRPTRRRVVWVLAVSAFVLLAAVAVTAVRSRPPAVEEGCGRNLELVWTGRRLSPTTRAHLTGARRAELPITFVTPAG